MEAQALEHERLLGQSAGDAALQHAIAAAELYMDAVHKAGGGGDRAKLTRKCNDLLALAERLKANMAAAAASGRPAVPESTRLLPAGEQAILLRASRLHGNPFVPWEASPKPDVFAAPGGRTDYYSDPADYSLSDEQKAIFAGWKRPLELFGRAAASRCMLATADSDLAQDLATDCSVVASLCAANRLLAPGPGSLLSSLIHPYDHKAGRPLVSPNGKYVFRMNFNGTWRQVVIDDRLPSSSTDRTLFVVDKQNAQLLWPALVEKAYLKIRGGYDFPGSNSGTDLHVLTGWIPEQIVLQDDELIPNEAWHRIQQGYDALHAVVTLGTGNISPEEQRTLGLITEHDYAVLDMKVEAGTRLLLIKNPWVDSLVWTGPDPGPGPGPGPGRSAPKSLTNTFWMSFEEVMQHFESLYVNWHPGIFPYRQDHHFSWDMAHPMTPRVLTQNPQYSVRSSSADPVWILLGRHWQDGELDILRRRKGQRAEGNGRGRRGTDTLADVSRQLGYMSLALFASTPPGTRIALAEGNRRLNQGPLVDSPNTLLRCAPEPDRPYTLVVDQAALPLPKYSFTLSFFSMSPLAIAPAPEPLPFHNTLSGAWTRRSAGGSAAHASYLTNPQFALQLPQRTQLALLLSTDSSDLPVHVAMLFSAGQRMGPVSSSSSSSSGLGRDVVAASPEYRRGCNAASAHAVEPGTYTVVVSTFEPGQLGRFALRVSSSVRLAPPVPVLPDAAGRLRTPVAAPAVFGPGQDRLRARLDVARLARLSLSARSVRLPPPRPAASSPGPAPCAIRVALELGRGPHRAVVACSGAGEFADAAQGLRTPEVDVAPATAQARGGLWLVVEQIGSQAWVGQGVLLDLLSDGAPVRVGAWDVADD